MEETTQTSTPRRKPRRGVVVVDGKLECNVCLVLVPVEDFYKDPKNRSGYVSNCKQCMRDAILLSRMGITRDRYNEILASQNGVCDICKQVETVRRRGEEVCLLSVDHDHACCPGRRSCGDCVRGLICHQCNIAVGVIESRGLTGAQFDRYLTRHGKTPPGIIYAQPMTFDAPPVPPGERPTTWGGLEISEDTATLG